MMDTRQDNSYAKFENRQQEQRDYAKIQGVSASQHQNAAGSPRPLPKVSCDQEAWVKQRIKTAMKMIVSVSQECGVGAEQGMLDRAVDGIINGCAEEIIRTLGMEPEYVNIPRYPRT